MLYVLVWLYEHGKNIKILNWLKMSEQKKKHRPYGLRIIEEPAVRILRYIFLSTCILLKNATTNYLIFISKSDFYKTKTILLCPIIKNINVS